MRSYELLTAALVAASTQAKQDICRGMVLSGGGNNGAWEAGVLYGLTHNGDPKDFEFDVVTGVSAGSINAGGMAGWEIGREAEYAEWLSDTWMGMSTGDIIQDWNLGKVSGVLIMGGVFDVAPMLNTLRHLIAEFDGYKRRVTLAAVNVDTGEYTQFDQKNTSFWDIPEAAIASASIPFVFPPHHFGDKGTFMDGGTVYNLNPEAAVHQCLELVDNESQIIIDVAICGVPSTPEAKTETGHSLENFLRNRAIHSFYGSTDSLESAMRSHPGVEFRHVIGQTEGHEGGIHEINFNGDFTWPLQEQGRKDATEALSGNGVSNLTGLMREWIENEDSLRGQFNRVGDFIIHRVSEAKQAAALGEESPLN